MNKSEVNKYLWACELAKVAMGKHKRWGDKKADWIANDDPLAWWCLVEAIMSGGKKP